MYDDDIPWRAVGVIAAVVILLTSGIYWMVTYRRETKETVIKVSWSRAIDIQTWMTVQESDWDIPAGGREIRNYRAIHHYDRVVSGHHEECRGTGKDRRCTTETDYRQDPVYRTKYDYWIERWITTRHPELHGDDHEATWPDVSDIRTHEALELGDERVGTAYSTYSVFFTNDYRLDITEGRWRTLNPGDKRTVVVNIFNQPQDFKENWT